MLSQKPWRAEAVIQLVAGVFVCLCLGVVTAGLLQQAGVAASNRRTALANILLATLSFQGAAWVLIFFFLKLHEVDWRDAFGFRNANLKKSLLLAAGALALVVAGGAVPATLSRCWRWKKSAGRRKTSAPSKLLANAKSVWMRAYLGFFAVVLAPVAEEFIFRGVLFPFVKQLGWPQLAWVGVSFLFALIHVDARDVRAAVCARAGADVALRKNGQPARAHRRAQLVQRGQSRHLFAQPQ